MQLFLSVFVHFYYTLWLVVLQISVMSPLIYVSHITTFPQLEHFGCSFLPLFYNTVIEVQQPKLCIVGLHCVFFLKRQFYFLFLQFPTFFQQLPNRSLTSISITFNLNYICHFNNQYLVFLFDKLLYLSAVQAENNRNQQGSITNIYLLKCYITL